MSEQAGIAKTHGHCLSGIESPTYRSWKAMRRRCGSALFKNYADISVCQEWKDFNAFLCDMGERPEGHSLDRIDNRKGYSKNNCRWSDRDTQNRNRGCCKVTEEAAKLIYAQAHKGVRQAEIAARFGCSVQLVSNIKNGHAWASVTGHKK